MKRLRKTNAAPIRRIRNEPYQKPDLETTYGIPKIPAPTIVPISVVIAISILLLARNPPSIFPRLRNMNSLFYTLYQNKQNEYLYLFNFSMYLVRLKIVAWSRCQIHN